MIQFWQIRTFTVFILFHFLYLKCMGRGLTLKPKKIFAFVYPYKHWFKKKRFVNLVSSPTHAASFFILIIIIAHVPALRLAQCVSWTVARPWSVPCSCPPVTCLALQCRLTSCVRPYSDRSLEWTQGQTAGLLLKSSARKPVCEKDRLLHVAVKRHVLNCKSPR